MTIAFKQSFTIRALPSWVVWCFQLVLAVMLAWAAPGKAHTAPALELGSQDYARLRIDLRQHLLVRRVPDQGRTVATAFDPQTVWSWPDSQFLAAFPSKPMGLQSGERLLAKLAVKVQASPHSLLVEFPMPRLDVAHLSYRYDNEPWTVAAAGDQIPMVQWPFANRHPVFIIPAKQGELQMVLDIAHQGLFTSPVYLLGDPGFREDRFNGALRTGALLGLAVVLALVSFAAAMLFKRFSFFAVALITVSVGLAVFCQGGVAGIYFGTHTTWFNDLSKFVTGMLFGALIPWTVATVVSQRRYSQTVWWLALLWAAAGLLATAIMSFTFSRGVQAVTLPMYLIGSLIFAFCIALASVVRGQAHAHWALIGVLFYSLGILAPLAAYWGFADGPQSFTISSLGFLVSSLLLVYTLVLQYRQGRMVIARAQSGSSRDVLTGLLNRQGFENVLAQKMNRIVAEDAYAAFFYIAVSDAQDLQERYGGEGFESGMVQMAAAISSSVSVVDTVARVAPNAFAVLVPMPRDAKLANALAQKMISRTMAIGSHSTPMAQTARIAIAWLPVFGTSLPNIERRALGVLRKMEEGKHIAWIGGNYAQMDRSQIPTTTANSSHSTQPNADQLAEDDDLPSIPSPMNPFERAMRNPDSEQLQVEADRLMRVMQAHEMRGVSEKKS
jgi:GGDEF domain-containing protein